MSNRASPALQIVRQFLVRVLASSGEPTTSIAATLGLSRSFAIKQAQIALKPRNPAERRILKVANEHRAKLQRMGISGLLGGEDIITTLAGGERPKLGPLSERREKREKAEAKVKAKKTTPKKTTPKKASAKAPEKTAPKPKDTPKAASKQKAPPKAKSNAAAKAAETRAAKKPKEKTPAALPEVKPVVPDSVAATIEDLLGDEAPAPDAPV